MQVWVQNLFALNKYYVLHFYSGIKFCSGIKSLNLYPFYKQNPIYMEGTNLIGAKITAIRLTKKITTEELAERCGFSKKMIEKLEAGAAIPSLGHLIKIARVLGVRLGTFMDDLDQLGPVVTRKGEANTGAYFSSSNNETGSGLTFHPLAGDKSGRHFEPFLIDIAPSPAPVTHLSAHEGEEFLYVLSGEIEISYGKESYHLYEGDSIYYDSVVDHHVHAATHKPARILAVVYAPF
jgi:transcriptional regulator with XRE-family HTH domain